MGTPATVQVARPHSSRVVFVLVTIRSPRLSLSLLLFTWISPVAVLFLTILSFLSATLKLFPFIVLTITFMFFTLLAENVCKSFL